MPAPHRPGQPPWPERGGRSDLSPDTTPIRPPGAEPIHFRAAPAQAQDNPALTWILRGLGLLAVAVISGLIWWYLNDEAQPTGSSAKPTEQQSGRFEFSPVAEPRHDSTCPEHAYGQIKAFFQTTQCQQLTRALYTTSTTDGRKVYTNVSVVRMATADDAAKLRELTDKEGTGNVNDLVREGIVKVPPLKSLSASDGYKAVQHDRNVIIVESDYDPAAKRGDKQQDEAALDTICEDAIRLGDTIGAGA